MGYGYTVSCSIDLINDMTDYPERYQEWQLRTAINDAKVHYEYGNASRQWYEYVVDTLKRHL